MELESKNFDFLGGGLYIRNVPEAHIAPKVHRFCLRQIHRIIAFTRYPFREIATLRSQ